MLINIRRENGITTLDYDAYVENILVSEAHHQMEILHTCIETELFDVLKPSYVEQLSQTKGTKRRLNDA